MRCLALLATILMVLTTSTWAQTATQDPPDIVPSERTGVALLLIETVVLDAESRTVSDLNREDFHLLVENRLVDIDTFDIVCPEGALEDPSEVDDGQVRALPPNPEMGRRIVFLVDYDHLSQLDRGRVTDALREMIRAYKTDGEQIMLAAIASGLRIEQRFTSDLEEVLRSVRRMSYDATLFAPDSRHTTANGYFEALSTLMDVLAEYDGPKAIVLFSAALGRRDTLKAHFEDVAQRAAASRTSIYPARARWFDEPTIRRGTYQAKGGAGGERLLARLAIDTGGRMPPAGYDLSLAYAWAQRDLGCRYMLGFSLDLEQASKPTKIRVAMKDDDLLALYPLAIRVGTDEERRQSRMRAAWVDPEPFTNRLVRGLAMPFAPHSRKRWDTLLAVHYPVTVGDVDSELEISASLRRGDLEVGELTGRAYLEGSKTGAPAERAVTLLGDARLKAGAYRMTVVVSEPGKRDVLTGNVEFEVPEVPQQALFVRGPVLAKTVRDGVLVRPEEQNLIDGEALEGLFGDAGSFEPLLVHQATSSDTLLAVWEACVAGNTPPTASGIRRRIVGADGAVVHQLPLTRLDLHGPGPVRCHGLLDRVPGDTLIPGEYRIEVAVVDDQGGEIVQRSVPLLVR